MYCNCKPSARALIRGGASYPDIRGEVTFYQVNCGVLVAARISGLPDAASGFHGFHIHAGDGCGGDGFADTEGHFNPGDKPHPQHAGDLPPLLTCEGNAFLEVKTDRFRVRDILGRTVVIHKGADDFRTQPAGDAGEKIACGVIQAV